MKFNWGTGIFIFVVLFMVFILSLVYKCSKQQVDLVSEQYYDNEIKYQQHMNRESNSLGLKNDIQIEQSEFGLSVYYPKDLDRNLLSGKIELFKPDDAQKDLLVNVVPDEENTQKISKQLLSKGWWIIKINWSENRTLYYFEDKVLLK